MIPQELIDRGQKVGLSKEELEDLYNNGFNPDFWVRTAERAKKSLERSRKTPLTPQQEEFLKDLSWVDKPTLEEISNQTYKFSVTIIGNGFLVDCPKIVGTRLADYLVLNDIQVSEIRFPFNKLEAQIYGKLNYEKDLEELVNTYKQEHGY